MINVVTMEMGCNGSLSQMGAVRPVSQKSSEVADAAQRSRQVDNGRAGPKRGTRQAIDGRSWELEVVWIALACGSVGSRDGADGSKDEAGVEKLTFASKITREGREGLGRGWRRVRSEVAVPALGWKCWSNQRREMEPGTAPSVAVLLCGPDRFQ